MREGWRAPRYTLDLKKLVSEWHLIAKLQQTPLLLLDNYVQKTSRNTIDSTRA
jgi:hypothetical protein